MNIYEIAEGIEICRNLLHPEVACRNLTAPQIRSTILALYKLVCMYMYVVCFDGCVVIVMQNDAADKTRPADVSNGSQQQLEQFRYENDKLKIALAQRFHRMT